MIRFIYLGLLLTACGADGRIVGGPNKCQADAECSSGLFCSNGNCSAPAQPLGEVPPLTSEELYGRIGQSEFNLDDNATDARQQVLFKVGIGQKHGFSLEDSLQDAHFNARFENGHVRIWSFACSVPGKEVVVPPLPGEEGNAESRFLLKNIRVRLMGDAVAPIVFGELPKASVDFKAPLVINADMGSGQDAVFGIELRLTDVNIHVDFDVASRRLTAHATISEQHLLYGQLDGVYLDGFSLDSVLEGVILPSSWVDNLP